MSDRWYRPLYTAAEDVMRLDPWERGITPFALRMAEGEGEAVLVVFDREGEAKQVRILPGAASVRHWLRRKALIGAGGTEELTAWIEDHYLVAAQDPGEVSQYEHKQLEAQDMKLVFRKKNPAQPLASIVEEEELETMLHFMRAIRMVLTRIDEEESPEARTGKESGVFSAPAWVLGEGQVQPAEAYRLRLEDVRKSNLPVLDEFTLARVARLPADEDQYELYAFYLPMATRREGGMYYPFSAFLVNLMSGVIEWSEVIVAAPGWQDVLLRKLWLFWLDQGEKPGRVLCANPDWQRELSADFRSSRLPFEGLRESYVGEELSASYIKMSRIKEKHYDQMRIPAEPEK